MALEDAVTLAACINKAGTSLESALEKYENARRPRAAKVIEASQRNGRIYHMRGAAALARNATMRIAFPERVMAGFDWLYGWKTEPC